MVITDKFECGNIRVISQTAEKVVIDQDCHNGDPPYFYWAFKVIREDSDRPGRVRFEFPAGALKMGDFGAAKSYDLVNWEWTGKTENNGFTYDFCESEREVYFAFCFVYTPKRLENFLAGSGIKTEAFTKSRKGREVPCFAIGSGERLIVFTSRHHACESTGTFVMEGIAKACLEAPLEGYRFLFVPFVDLDGVIDGDAGKNRNPFDHNRDYSNDPAIYPETAKLKKVAESRPVAAFDLHAPWIKGREHDTVYFLRGPENRFMKKLSENLKRLTASPDCFSYTGEWDFPYGVEWNESDKPNMMNYFLKYSPISFAATVEMSYFGSSGNPFTAERVIKFGEKFYEALCDVPTD